MLQTFEPIGILRTDFREKFGVPRQPLMVTEARGVLKLNPVATYRAALNHLDTFTHVWVIFVFHQEVNRPWSPCTQPPRAGLVKDLGVFASRSPRRPNPIGMSALKLERIDYQAVGGIEIHFSGVDILDETPVLDIKPYVPYADKIDSAGPGWAIEDSTCHPVSYSPESEEALKKTPDASRLKRFITQILERDPRPNLNKRSRPIDHPANQDKYFSFRILDVEVHWQVKDGVLHVADIFPCIPESALHIR